MPPVNNYTERDFLDRIWKRYAHVKSLGDAPRYLVSEHPRTPMGDYGNNRVIDCLVLDRHRHYGQPTRSRRPDGSWNVQYQQIPFFPVLGFEVKVSRSDWLREISDPEKAKAWQQYCTHFYIVAPRGIVKEEELPPFWGLMVPRGQGLMATKQPEINTGALPMPSQVVSAVTYAAIKTYRTAG